MTIDLKWLVQDQVIFAYYQDDISLEEFIQNIADIQAMIEVSNAPSVHVVVDNTRVGSYPNSITILRDVIQKLVTHPQYGWLVVYGRNDTLTRFAIRVTMRIFRAKVRILDTRLEALNYLIQVDPSLESALKSIM